MDGISRAGGYTLSSGVRSFEPAPLPPNPPIEMTNELVTALSTADRALARLDGATLTLPDPELFVYAFLRQEAVLSSQIEGTQASLEDLLRYEAALSRPEPSDVEEILNYNTAIRWGLEQLNTLPISLRLIKGMHSRLLRSGRGAQKGAGEFRQSQNWIGPPGCNIDEASFVPPAVPLMKRAIEQLEIFIHQRSDLPPLIKCALVHSQFETIHPFWDGNGRLGRMLITLILCSEGILSSPVLYLSLFFKQHRQAYYDALQSTRDQGNFEGWIVFFLRAVTTTSKVALQNAQQILQLQLEIQHRIATQIKSNKATLFLDWLFREPYTTVNICKDRLSISYPAANRLVKEFVAAGILVEVTGGLRYRVFVFASYVSLLNAGLNYPTEFDN